MGQIVDWNQPLTDEILRDPEHCVVVAILRIPSLLQDPYTWMTMTQRRKQDEFIPFLGAYAFALGQIV